MEGDELQHFQRYLISSYESVQACKTINLREDYSREKTPTSDYLQDLRLLVLLGGAAGG